MKLYYADCDQHDNHRTGLHLTPEAAEAAFWDENTFSESERKRIRVYTRSEEVDVTRLHEEHAELLAALERFVDIHNTGSTGLCPFCTRHRTKHTRECPMTQAIAAITKAQA